LTNEEKGTFFLAFGGDQGCSTLSIYSDCVVSPACHTFSEKIDEMLIWGSGAQHFMTL